MLIKQIPKASPKIMKSNNNRKKHHVKMHSVVGLHKSLSTILDKQKVIINGVNAGNVEDLVTKSFTFDSCFLIANDGEDLVDTSLLLSIESCASLLLGGYHATIFLSDLVSYPLLSTTQARKCFDDIGIISSIVEKIGSFNSSATVFEDGENNFDRAQTVTISCYEVFDTSLTDLLAPNVTIPYLKSNVSSKRYRINQTVSETDGSISMEIDGLVTEVVNLTSTLAIARITQIIHSALANRSVLIKSVSSARIPASGSTNISAGSQLIGAVGNVFISIKIVQTWQGPSAETGSRAYCRASTLTAVSLANASTYKSMQISANISMKQKDVLVTGANELTTYAVMKWTEFQQLGNNRQLNNKIYQSEDVITPERLQIQLNGALKALSSLSRIVQLRRNREIFTNNDEIVSDKKTSEKFPPMSSLQQHIPYRDSILTRLLQPSLEGNCFLYIFLYVRPKSMDPLVNNQPTIDENTIRMLQFASEISSIRNIIWANDSLVSTFHHNPSITETSNQTASILINEIMNSNQGTPLIKINEKDTISTTKKKIDHDYIQRALSVLSDELKLWDLDQLDCVKNLGKEIVPTKTNVTYKHNKKFKESDSLDEVTYEDSDFDSTIAFEGSIESTQYSNFDEIGRPSHFDGKPTNSKSFDSGSEFDILSQSSKNVESNIVDAELNSSNISRSNLIQPDSARQTSRQSNIVSLRNGSMKPEKANGKDMDRNRGKIVSAVRIAKLDDCDFADNSSLEMKIANQQTVVKGIMGLKQTKAPSTALRGVPYLPPIVKPIKNITTMSKMKIVPSASTSQKINASDAKNANSLRKSKSGSSLNSIHSNSISLPIIDNYSPSRKEETETKDCKDFDFSMGNDPCDSEENNILLSNDIDIGRKEPSEIKPTSEQEDQNAEDLLNETERHFIHSVARGYVDLVDDCIAEGVDLSVRNRFNRDALQIAARNGFLPILKRLFKAYGGRMGSGLLHLMSSRTADTGDSVLHIAARYGHVDILRWLREIGFSFNVINLKGRTVVHAAAERAQFAVLKSLFDAHGLNINFAACDNDGLNPLECVPHRTDSVSTLVLQQCRDFLSDIYTYS